METKNRQKILLIVVGVGALLWLGDIFLFEPLLASWDARTERIAQLRKQVDDGTRMLNREASLRGRWDEMRTNSLPPDVSQAEAQMLRSFDRWERASGITRVSIKPQWKSEEDYMTVEWRADYSGDITRIKNFLYQIENDPTGLRVESVEISSHDDNGQQLTLGLTLNGLRMGAPPESEQQ
jgi:hypothetical protein